MAAADKWWWSGQMNGSGPMARILAMDKGPGIADVTRAMGDGYSTAGTMGGGLGAMKRIATALEIFTSKAGTIVMLELGQEQRADALQIAGIALPYPGERFCGDAWSSYSAEGRTLTLLADGLGHGWEAAEAAKEAVATFQQRAELAPGQILQYVHDALRKTRGAVAAIAEIRPKEQILIFAGVGNIYCSLFSAGASRSFVSHNGTLGMTMSRIQEFRCDWPKDARAGTAFGWRPIEVGSFSVCGSGHTSPGGDRRRHCFAILDDSAMMPALSWSRLRELMSEPIVRIALTTERDVVQARQRAREVAAELGLDNQDQIRLATATSEMARNAFRYARNGKVTFALELEPPQRLEVTISDRARESRIWTKFWKDDIGRRPGWGWGLSARSA